MLRASIWPSKQACIRRLPYAITAIRQWQIAQKCYTDQKKPNSKDEISDVHNKPDLSLSSQGHSTFSTKVSDYETPTLFNSSSLTSPSPPQAMSSDLEETHHIPRVLTPRKPRRIFRKLATFLTFFTVLGFTGGVYYSMINDNFHDFFTEFIPFGEQAVLYLEELEYKKKFPASSELGSSGSGSITSIPRQSGVSWRIAEGQKPGSTGRHSDATNLDINSVITISEEKVDPASLCNEKNSTTFSSPSVKESSLSQPLEVQNDLDTPQSLKPSESTESVAFTMPEVDQPSRFPPEITRIDPITMKDANEPLVQDLVKIINNIILVVQADNSNAKFSSTIEKAKEELSQVGSRILALKEQAHKEADAKIQAEKEDFDRAAKELIRRVELEMQNHQANWQEEYQAEREKIQMSYEKRLSSELQRANELHEQRLRNALLEQAIEIRRKFSQEIKDCVEEERNGRLKNLSELSSTVAELEKLASNWNSVIDYNLKTQQLLVAVEATRVFIEKSEEPRPFLRELVALREIASDNPVVDAAIASINPTAYHHGIPSLAQIIDRFRRVATEVRKAALLSEDAGIASHASSYVLSKLLFKRKGLARGDYVESILTRAETYLEEGDLDTAAREVNGLKGWAKTLSQDWLNEVRRVLEVRQALEVIAAEARLESLTVE